MSLRVVKVNWPPNSKLTDQYLNELDQAFKPSPMNRNVDLSTNSLQTDKRKE
jgi:hypothetical protein